MPLKWLDRRILGLNRNALKHQWTAYEIPSGEGLVLVGVNTPRWCSAYLGLLFAALRAINPAFGVGPQQELASMQELSNFPIL
jgi:hypothetical protein